jgi:hypothetical protein
VTAAARRANVRARMGWKPRAVEVRVNEKGRRETEESAEVKVGMNLG